MKTFTSQVIADPVLAAAPGPWVWFKRMVKKGVRVYAKDGRTVVADCNSADDAAAICSLHAIHEDNKRLRKAIRVFLEADVRRLGWPNRRELAAAIGLPDRPLLPPPSREEFCRQCTEYEDQLYDGGGYDFDLVIGEDSPLLDGVNRILYEDNQQLRHAIHLYLGAEGHGLCWLNRQELAKAVGAVAKEPAKVPRSEFRAGCLRYEEEIYGRADT